MALSLTVLFEYSAPIVLVPVPDNYKNVSHTGVGNVTNIEECDVTMMNVTNTAECA